MKIAIIIHIYINGKHEDLHNFHPISSLPQFYNIFEKIVSIKCCIIY